MSNLPISVTIESRLSGPASGYMVLHTEPSATVESLIVSFVVDRGVKYSPNYVLRTSSDIVLEGSRSLLASDVVDGDVLYLANRSASDETFGFNNWFIMALLAVVISVTGLIAISLIYSTTGRVPQDYGVIFDAGSTHTTMTVYSWGGAKLNGTGEPKQTHTYTMKGGGIAMYVGREDQLAHALKDCLNDAKNAIPGGKVGTTPLYLGATGGMRLLQIKDPNATDIILQTVDRAFLISGFRYQSGMASIISGQDEGADAWITSNYVTDKLTMATSESNSVSSLDLGGASTQFAVETDNTSSSTDILDVSLYGLPHSVFVRSYLCFGIVQSFSRRTAQLTVDVNNAAVIMDPCLPSGFNVTMSMAQIFASPCTMMNSSLIPDLPPTTNLTFIGTSSEMNCSKQVKSLFNTTECNTHYQYDQCFTSENLAAYPTQFMAISSFYYVMQFLNLSQPSLEDFLKAVINACEKPWPQTRLMYQAKVGGGRTPAQYYCYQGLYVYHLLTTGYGFSNKTWDKLLFMDSVNSTDLGWSMGFMINVTNGVPAEVPAQPIALPVFVCLVLLFSIFFLLAFGFFCHACRQKRDAAPYQRLSQYGAI